MQQLFNTSIITHHYSNVYLVTFKRMRLILGVQFMLLGSQQCMFFGYTNASSKIEHLKISQVLIPCLSPHKDDHFWDLQV
jgi:hypothetical protein